MRRDDLKKGKSVTRQYVMQQMRDMRTTLESQCPGFLERAHQALSQETEIKEESTELTIDRKKNMQTVMTFIHLKNSSPGFKSRLRQILEEFN